jgi:hypothetical protein
MRLEISAEAARLARERGGRVWVWAAVPRACCASTAPLMHAATERPAGLAGFARLAAAGVEVCFRPPAGRCPEVLEIAVRGRRRPRIEAYWDGCLMAL